MSTDMGIVENVNIERIARLEAQVETIKEDVAEVKQDIKALNQKIEDGNRRIVEHLDNSINELAKADQEQHTALRQSMENVKSRVDLLEKWKWMIIGGAVVIGYLVGHADFIANILK
jgi:predicted  nucleic acid-binding Zn-ribbon protein